MKRYIKSTSNPDSPLDDNIANLKADFDYIMDGLEKLGRMGSDKAKEALSVSLELNGMLSDITEDISNLMIN